jgi:hypothetical protein
MTRPARRPAIGVHALAFAAALFAGVGQRAARAQDGAAERIGRVRFVTEKRAYLDKGADDGLALRQNVSLLRGAAKVASCQIEILATHTAVCRGSGAEVGDTFEPPAPGARPPAPAKWPRPLPAPEDDETLARYESTLADAPHAKVDFVSNAGAGLPRRIWVGVSGALYSDSGSADRYAYEAIDAEIRNVSIGSGSLRFDAAFTALRRQTTIDPRFRPSVESMFYLWEAEITRRQRDDRTVFAIGRLWPWHLPGLPMLDGAQIGRRNAAGTIEGGVYGGAIPTALTLSPIDGSWAGGAYGAATQGGSGARVLSREEVRVGVRDSATAGLVREAEAIAQFWSRPVQLGAGGRLRHAPLVDGGPVLELAQGDLRFAPTTSMRARAQLRYLGVAAESQALLRGEVPTTMGGYHGTVDLSWDAFRRFGIGLLASGHHDRQSNNNQADAGLELRAPRLFGDLGGMAAGASAGEGWLRSRNAFVQMMARTERLRIFGRVGGSSMQFAEPQLTPLTVELGGNVQVEYLIAPWLRVVGRSLVRAPVVLQGQLPPSALYGIVSRIDLVGTY